MPHRINAIKAELKKKLKTLEGRFEGLKIEYQALQEPYRTPYAGEAVERIAKTQRVLEDSALCMGRIKQLREDLETIEKYTGGNEG